MKRKAIYEVQMGGQVDVFGESAAGAVDFEGTSACAETQALAQEVLGGEFPRAELGYPDDNFGSPIYRFAHGGAQRVLRRASTESGVPPAGILGFLRRYASFAAYLEAGNYGAAGRLVERSRKLRPFKALLRYISGPRAFLVFALYWLGEFDGAKEAALVSLLSGNLSARSQYDVSFDFGRGAIGARNISEFDAECRNRLRELLVEEKQPLVMEVAGPCHRPCIDRLAMRIESAQDEAFRRAVLDGQSEQESTRPISDFLESIKVLLVPEPYNSNDWNALSVLLRFPNGRMEQAGYVKREIAAIPAPTIAEGVSLSGQLYDLRPGGADVQVRVG